MNGTNFTNVDNENNTILKTLLTLNTEHTINNEKSTRDSSLKCEEEKLS